MFSIIDPKQSSLVCFMNFDPKYFDFFFHPQFIAICKSHSLKTANIQLKSNMDSIKSRGFSVIICGYISFNLLFRKMMVAATQIISLASLFSAAVKREVYPHKNMT